jgi:arabinofuranan 3-O-arabinosyltransferase
MIDAPWRPVQPAWPALLQRLVTACRNWLAAPGGRSRWLVLCCVALAALAFVSHPGNIISDTKLDLAVNPAGFLARALQLWDPSQFGQLQDQAVGYIFPVGPLFLLAKAAAVPGWVAQRIWIALMLLAAFLGIVRLADRLGIGTPASRIAAGFGYALAPNALGMLGTLSSEFLPIAMLPWILIPLVRAAAAGPDMRATGRLTAAAQSAVAVALCSGINAAATCAVLIPPVIFLLTAPRPAPRWRIIAWWVPAAALATFWWTFPLLLQLKYGASVLPYTESAALTTSPTSLFNTLRGTENWITYLVVNGKPWEPVAYRISTEALPTLLTALIAGAGLRGLASRRLPHRRFLLATLLVGILIIVAGYAGAFGSPFASAVGNLINGPLAPLRNLRKFDPLIRLPIALGLAALPASVRVGRARLAASAAVAATIGLLALPVYVSGLGMDGSFTSIPGYWLSAATWLNRHAGDQGILEEPGARFGQYTWGSPMDDVLQPFLTGNWAGVQNSDLGSVGNMRLLEAVDRQISAGDGSAGLTEVLAGLGVKYVVVRNDLIRSDLYGAWPARIHQALAESPGIVKVAQFGSAPAGSHPASNATSSFDAPYPPVEIYRVESADPVAIIQPAADAVRVFGAPESVLALADDNVLAGQPVLLNNDDPAAHTGSTVVTDSLRRVVRNFGEIRIDYSQTQTATAPLNTFDAVTDFTEPGWNRYVAVAKYFGIANVVASSAESGILAPPARFGTGLNPFSAIDGNPATMWESNSATGVGQYLRIRFLTRLNPHTIRVAFADTAAVGPPVARVVVTTAAGRVADAVRNTGDVQTLRVPAGPTRWLQITIAALRHERRKPANTQVGIKDITIPGVHPSRTIEAPTVNLAGGADPSAVVLAKAEPQPSGCMLTSVRWVCSPRLIRPTEEQYGFDESFTVSRPETATLSGAAVLTNPRLIQAYAFPGANQPDVTASSAYTADPEDQGYSAFDNNPLTTWISGATDTHPTLTIRWRGVLPVGTVTITRPPGDTSPLPVQITGSGGQVRTGVVGRPGAGGSAAVTFAPMRTSSLTLRFTPAHRPVQITDVTIPGVAPLRSGGTRPVTLPCGRGPDVSVNGRRIPTQAVGTFADLLDGQSLEFSACSAVPVARGPNRVVEPSSDAFSIQSVALRAATLHRPAAGPPAGTAGTPRVLAWTSSRRVLRVSAAAASYLTVTQNFNAGWQATLHGRVLQPVRLDGWEQAWLLPAGSAGSVTLSYRPDGPFRMSVFGGLAVLLVIMIIAWVPWRRRSPVGRPAAGGRPAAAGQPAAVGRPAAAGQPAAVGRPAAAGQPAPAGRSSGPASPGQTWSAIWGIRAATAVIALVLSAFAGLWIGGYLAALLIPAGTAVFLAAEESGAESGLARLLASPWLAGGLLAAASVCAVLGARLTGEPSSLLSHSLPQLLCFAIVARLIAAFLGDFRAADRTEAAQAGDAEGTRGGVDAPEARPSAG